MAFPTRNQVRNTNSDMETLILSVKRIVFLDFFIHQPFVLFCYFRFDILVPSALALNRRVFVTEFLPGFTGFFFSWDDCFQFPLVVVVVVVEDIEDVAVTRFFVSLLTWLSTGALPSWKKNWNSAITRPSIVFFTSFSAHAIVLLQD